MTGPAVRAALDPVDRARFEAQFRTALVEVTRSFDVERLAEVVRDWWIRVGGDPAVAEQDRAVAARAASLAERTREHPCPVHVPQRVVNRTGPVVRAALPEPARVEFDTQFERALVEAAETFDHRPAHRVVLTWWAVALRYANPDDRESGGFAVYRVCSMGRCG